MIYLWDEEKDFENFIKHQIWFLEAKVIWEDEHAREFYDADHSQHENRWIRIGVNPEKGVLFVVFCEGDNDEIVRLISARKANEDEKVIYRFGNKKWKRNTTYRK